MDLTELLLIFPMIWKITSGINCYECAAYKDPYREQLIPLCEHFNYNKTFVKECDSSSMCYKRVTTTQFGTKIYERGCALQIQSGYQERLQEGWRPVKKINEVYDEGCVESPGDVERVTRTEHCYCRGTLCNSAAGLTINVFVFLTVIMLLVLR